MRSIAAKIIKKINTRVSAQFETSLPVIQTLERSADSTVKLLLEFPDANRVETVILPFPRRHTICLSTQVGCAMGCTFCSTGTHGFIRNLTHEEIVAQYLASYVWLEQANPNEIISKPNIVFMGEGEPLHNFDNVKQACELFLSPNGVCVGPRQILLSTVGYVPGLERLSELPPINIALSLHSADSHKRKELIPLEKSNGLEKIVPLLKKVSLKKHQYINFEYLLIAGFNDREEDARALQELVSQFEAVVNLIPYNEIPGLSWKQPTEKRIQAFKTMLTSNGIRTLVRVSKGRDINAACGQLKGSARQ
ncbi:MAG: 23S rRNA (adenine(2503)-C(2))-methyltransferase RlmN [bacterium]|nr:23S rRNA (adenine(2503)-C(2))-methyltransferase RlmN [bacterium]